MRDSVIVGAAVAGDMSRPAEERAAVVVYGAVLAVNIEPSGKITSQEGRERTTTDAAETY